MQSSELRDLLRRTFLSGYECGRNDEREERDMDADLPDNVVSLEDARDALNRKQLDA